MKKFDVRGMSLYGAFLAVFLSAGWLLPNHYPPWTTFHTNAWIGCALVVIAFWRLANDPTPVALSRPVAFLALVALIPWLQYWSGLVHLPSAALMGSIYLLGLAVAFALGEHWARAKPGAPAGLILGAAALAALLSVALQTYQWLGLARNQGFTDIWVFPSLGDRPFANLGQPNLLASLLMWGLLGVLWARNKGWVGRGVAAVLCAIVLFGVALTESRAAAVILTVGVITLSMLKFSFVERRFVRGAQAFYFGYLLCLLSLARLGRMLGLDSSLTVYDRSAGELRGEIWRLALEAASLRPWLGWGWDQSNEGFLAVFPHYPKLANLYVEHSHNLLLDLTLWVGAPLAVVLVVTCGRWLLRVARSVRDMEQLLTLAAMVVMLMHAMLEMPLQQGYFLWPFGVLAGSAAARLKPAHVLEVSRRSAVAAMLAFSAVLAVLVYDYFKVEAAFAELRFSLYHIGRNHDERPPDTVFLGAWADFITMSREMPTAGMSEEKIQHWKHLLIYNTSPLAFRKVIGALALNGHPQEARFWDERTCAVLHPKLCNRFVNEWASLPAASELHFTPDPR